MPVGFVISAKLQGGVIVGWRRRKVITVDAAESDIAREGIAAAPGASRRRKIARKTLIESSSFHLEFPTPSKSLTDANVDNLSTRSIWIRASAWLDVEKDSTHHSYSHTQDRRVTYHQRNAFDGDERRGDTSLDDFDLGKAIMAMTLIARNPIPIP
ncbi:hypothetical protein BT96DRAFT_1004595 [Gymnopus androsaceus JB14]|uniref:Uncharacterized protein n=1 Tax=Gymnopus androsaceus JB14 TaxID=1447944 RepID=A0A6A4GQG9_9AGAR|nr:hypothetical protein BT96DRAFT_1004595 [Gymnopus androsaceus JB14]